MARRIVAVVYGGGLSDAVVRRARGLALERTAEVVIVHVTDDDFLRSLPGAFHTPATAMQSLKNVGRVVLERYQKELRDHGVAARTLVREGGLMEEIREIVSEVSAETLVVGSYKQHYLEEHHRADWERLRRETGVEIVVVD